MHYPHFLLDENISAYPIVKKIGEPLYIDMSSNNPYLMSIDIQDQQLFQSYIEGLLTQSSCKWAISGYLENRSTLLRNYKQMVENQRFFHLGIDVICPLNTPIYAPFEGTVMASGYEKGIGNYGGYVLIRHQLKNHEVFYTFYGHLNINSLPNVGHVLNAGDQMASIGDLHENGNWFHHLHLQVLTEYGYQRGYASKGYCRSEDLVDIANLCPDPTFLII